MTQTMNDSPTKPTVYPAADPSPSFAKLEEATLKWWESEKIFQRSIERRRKAGAAR